MLIWDLRDYPLNPTFEGGSIHGVLPKLRLIEGLNQKGLFTYAGAAQAGGRRGGAPVQSPAGRLNGPRA